MKISHNQIDGLLKAYSQQVRQGRDGAAQPQEVRTLGQDKLTLSDQARQLQTVREAVAKTPDVRQDRVDTLKKAVDSGTYNVQSSDIAEKMLGRALADKLGR